MPTSTASAVTTADVLARLPLLRLRLEFAAAAGQEFDSGLAGPVLRGAFGAALLRGSCFWRGRGCPPCRQPGNCAYGSLFDRVATAAAPQLGAQSEAPHPLVLSGAPGESPARFDITLTLIGRHAAGMAAGACQAAEAALDSGLGAQRVRGRLKTLQRWDAAVGWVTAAGGEPAEPVLPCRMPGDAVDILLRSPARLMERGRLLLPGQFAGDPFVRALLRRISLLLHFHGEPGPQPDWAGWRRQAMPLQYRPLGLHRTAGERWSARQQQVMPLDGLLGRFRLSGPALAGLAPLLELGQYVHIGKGTIHGLGAYRLAWPEPGAD